MPTFSAKMGKTNFICVAHDFDEALQIIRTEGERIGVVGAVAQVKEVDARVIGITEPGYAQVSMFPQKEA